MSYTCFVRHTTKYFIFEHGVFNFGVHVFIAYTEHDCFMFILYSVTLLYLIFISRSFGRFLGVFFFIINYK
jgi:hypothetical protein